MRSDAAPTPLDARHLSDPRSYCVRTRLRDGTRAVVRAIRRSDRSALAAFVRGLSRESLYSRFLGPKRGLSEAELDRFSDPDFAGHVGLVVVASGGAPERILAVGRFFASDDAPATADVAFTVADEFQGRGLGKLLLAHLAAIARAKALRAFRATA